ncbi:hypothetical protein [Bacillus thuringiensis]|uniref:hypothetical protein n=1 Tax=Bacillus thuringiensis TaxID=1428 RepID=UPI0037C90F51
MTGYYLYEGMQMEFNGEKVAICGDAEAVNPREKRGTLGRIVCFDKKHRLGDEHAYETELDFKNEINDKNAVILPIYLHEGRTLEISVVQYSELARHIGYIYVNREMIRTRYQVNRVSKVLKQEIVQELMKEVKQYDYYLKGQVYGYQVFNPSGEIIESRFGFYGPNPIANGLTDFLPGFFME